jgi:hypothetical protein
MITDPADNGEALNPVENDVGIVNNDNSFDAQIKSILFSDEELEGQPEPQSNESEVQTEEEKPELEATADGQEQQDTETSESDDGEAVHSQEEGKAEQTEQEVSGFQKRIDKLTALRKQAEEKSEKLEEEIESYKSRLSELEKASERPATSAENPFADLDTEDRIKAEYEQARELRYRCEANPDGFEYDGNYFSAAQVRDLKLNAMKAMEVQLPKQLEFVKARNHWKPLAQETYPWFKNKESQEYKLAQQVIKNFPKFKDFPDYEMFVGDYVRGYMARNAASITKNKPAKAVPQMQVRPTSSPTQASKTDISSRKIEDRYLKTQNRDDLKQIVSKYL